MKAMDIEQRAEGQATKETSPWLFIAMAVALTWLFWIPAIFVGRAGATVAATAPHLRGEIGPLAATLFLLYRSEKPVTRKDYWQRIVDWRCIDGRWLLVIFLTSLMVTMLAALVDRMLGGSGLTLPSITIRGSGRSMPTWRL